MRALIAATAATLIGMLSTSAELESDKWQSFDVPLEKVHRKSPDKNILVVFLAHWDLSGPLLRDHWLQSDEIMKLVNRPDLLTYVADCTEPHGSGSKEMRLHGVNAAPAAAALQHADGQITFARLNLSSTDTLKDCLQKLIDKAEAEDANAGSERE